MTGMTIIRKKQFLQQGVKHDICCRGYLVNTTTRFTIVDDLSWLTERIILAAEQLLNPQGSALLDIREFSWFNCN